MNKLLLSDYSNNPWHAVHGIFGKKYFPLHAVCDILIPKSIVYRFKKAQSFQPVGRAAFTLRIDKKISKKGATET